MKHKREAVNFITNIIITVIAIFLIFALIVLFVICMKINKETMEIADFMGYKPIICVSNSMQDEFEVGDIVIVKKVEENEINKGDIITFREQNTVITHRVENIEYDELDGRIYITKGDSNNVVDENIVKYSDIEGKYQYRIPKIGNLILMIKNPQGFLIVFFIPIVILAICYKLMLNRKELKELRKRKLLKRLQEQKIIENDL